MIGRVIAIYYDKYGKLLEAAEDQLMLDNDQIVKDKKDTEKAENVGDRGDIRDVGEAGNARDAGDVRDVGDKEASRGNEERE